VPGATCLPQALAARHLLKRAGYAAQLRIGVAKDKQALFQAHAWVEVDGAVVADRSAGQGDFYTPLLRR
jgi:hypothetical protein